MNVDTLAFRPADAMGDLWMELSSDAAQDPAPMPSNHQRTTLAKAIAVSAAFPQRPTDRAAPHLCLLSADNVHFYVHRSILAASNNAFDGILDGISPGLAEETPPVVPVEETSAVLNLVLHILYRKPVHDDYVPSVYDVLATVDALEQYGIPVHPHLMPAEQLCTLLLYYAPLRPLEVYITAARYDVYTLASAASAYLHNHSILDISDGLVLKMGSLYLKRLAELFEKRMDLLRTLVLTLPPFHETTFQCSYTARSKLVSGWTYAVTELACDASPGLSPARIRNVFELHESDVACSDCRARYKGQVKAMLMQWSMAQRTI